MPTVLIPGIAFHIIVKMESIETIVSVIASVLTATLIILNYIMLRGSVKQNALSIELYEKNLALSEESIALNRSLLEENRKMIERQEMDNRPKFRIMQEGFRFDPVTGKPHIYLENIGGKEAQAKKIQVTITKNLISIIKDMEINRSVKPGAPLNLEIDLPATVFEYKVSRKDGQPMKDNETIFLSVSGIIEYTHIADAKADVDPFTDTVGFKIGSDYQNCGDHNCTHTSRRSGKKDTWYSLLGTGEELNEADECICSCGNKIGQADSKNGQTENKE